RDRELPFRGDAAEPRLQWERDGAPARTGLAFRRDRADEDPARKSDRPQGGRDLAAGGGMDRRGAGLRLRSVLLGEGLRGAGPPGARRRALLVGRAPAAPAAAGAPVGSGLRLGAGDGDRFLAPDARRVRTRGEPLVE